MMDNTEQIPEHFYVFLSHGNMMAQHNGLLIGSLCSAGLNSLDPATLSIDDLQSGRYDPRLFTWEPGQGFVQNPNALPGAVAPRQLSFLNGNTRDPHPYRTELVAEAVRQRVATTTPSRLSGLFAFGDWSSCELASTRHRWPLSEVERFTPRYLVVPPHRGNMEFASAALSAHVAEKWTPEQNEMVWTDYWNSEATTPLLDGTIEAPALWEYLIEGRIDLDRDWENPARASNVS